MFAKLLIYANKIPYTCAMGPSGDSEPGDVADVGTGGQGKLSLFPAVAYEPRNWDWEGQRPSGRADRLFRSYESTIPPNIVNVDLALSRETLSTLNDAVAAVGALERDPNVRYAGVAGALLRSESVGSSRIEQLDVNAQALGLAAIDEGRPKSAAAQVWANVRAMTAAIEAAADSSITPSTFHMIHGVLMHDDPHERPWAGRVRTMQNWIGGSDECPRDALHVPPAPERVDGLMADLAEWCNRPDIAPLQRAAIAHAQFETIHPYTDGNGRTGRAIIHTILRQGGLVTASIVPTSSALLADVNGYFDSLGAYRAGDVDSYLQHFAAATSRASAQAQILGQELSLVASEWHASQAFRPGSIAASIASGLIQQPVISASQNAALGRRDVSSIYRAIDLLVDQGILSEITESKRNRVWVAKEVTAALDEFSRRLGQRQDGRLSP
jgi:Fic family protein